MANSLSDFIAYIKRNSIARVNRFRVSFAMPPKLTSLLTSGGTGQTFVKSINVFDDPKLKPQVTYTPVPADDLSTIQKVISLTCLMADIPGRQELASSIEYGNYSRKVVFGRSTNDFVTSFLVSGKYVEKKLFDAWHSIICDETQTAVEFYDDYISNIFVECMNENDDVLYNFELLEAYPTSVSSVRLDRTAQNQQMVMDVSWAYHRIIFGPDSRNLDKILTNDQAIPNAIPGANSGKNRILEVPGLSSLSSAVQTAVDTVSEFKGQLDGVLNVVKDVREQVRDAKMQAIEGVKVLNGVVKDVKAINNVPNDVKDEVIAVVNDTKNQIGYMKNDIQNIANYPKR